MRSKSTPRHTAGMVVKHATSGPRRRPGRLLALASVVLGALYLYSEMSLVGTSGWAERSAAPDEQPASAPEAVATVSANGLHRGLVRSLRRAREAAAEEGLTIPVASGHRDVAEQTAELDEAIEKYGSRQEAERWVFPPEKSMHVRGLAIDIGDGPSADWLLANGSRYGLCQTLSWEWWHFEWRRSWERAESCPAPVDNPEDAYVTGG
jgi:zinc D-Ala-D-Ala carboxypeptidase